MTAGRGRPRDPHAEAAIVQATLELLDEAGFARLTLESVAARAGVGKATIYRRWPGKAELVVHALATVTETRVPEPACGPLRDDLVATLDRVLRKHTSSLAGRLLDRLVGEEPGLIACYRDQVIEPRRARLVERLRRGVESGELRADVDLDLLSEVLVGTLLHAAMTRNPQVRAGRAYVEGVVDLVLTGAAAPPG